MLAEEAPYWKGLKKEREKRNEAAAKAAEAARAAAEKAAADGSAAAVLVAHLYRGCDTVVAVATTGRSSSMLLRLQFGLTAVAL